MAINIGKNSDGDVTYQNPPVNRTLFPNITEYSTPEEIEAFVNAWLDEHPEATTTVEDGSILPVKLDSTNSASDGYVLSYNATEGKFEWYDIGGELDEINSDITDLKQDLFQFNLFDEVMEIGNINNSGGNGGSTDRLRSKNYMRVYEGYVYYFNIPSTSSFFRVAWYNSSKTFISYSDSSTMRRFTAPSNACYVRIGLAPSYGITYNNDICINISQPETSVSPHNGEYVSHNKEYYGLFMNVLQNAGKIADIIAERDSYIVEENSQWEG